MAKVSRRGGAGDYGVVLTGSVDGDDLAHDADATAAERAGPSGGERAVLRPRPGYARLAGGAAHAEVDLLALRTPIRLTG